MGLKGSKHELLVCVYILEIYFVKFLYASKTCTVSDTFLCGVKFSDCVGNCWYSYSFCQLPTRFWDCTASGLQCKNGDIKKRKKKEKSVKKTKLTEGHFGFGRT